MLAISPHNKTANQKTALGSATPKAVFTFYFMDKTKIIIHSCPSRLWYVQDYLIPSLQDQGIENIIIKNDTYRIGNLLSFVLSCKDAGNAWHLQDDVIICKDFYKRIKEIGQDLIACGFVSTGFELEDIKAGIQPLKYIWYSFPCIYIPGSIADEFFKWFYFEAREDKKYSELINSRKADDELFRLFLLVKHKDMKINNIKPALVDHIDYLLGGSQVNPQRIRQSRATFFKDKDLVNELEKALAERRQSIE